MKSEGSYLYFFKEYFDIWNNEWKFDVDDADVKVMLLGKQYCPSVHDKRVDQIKKYEIKKKNVTIKVKGKKLKAPNGYDEGGKSIGPITTTQNTEECLNHFDEWETWTTTSLIATEEEVSWGDDDTLEEYPYRATFDVGTIIYYLDQGHDSPLISYFNCDENCYKGTFSITHSPKGFTKAHVNEDDRHLFKLLGVHWSQGFTCRKKKRGVE